VRPEDSSRLKSLASLLIGIISQISKFTELCGQLQCRRCGWPTAAAATICSWRSSSSPIPGRLRQQQARRLWPRGTTTPGWRRRRRSTAFEVYTQFCGFFNPFSSLHSILFSHAPPYAGRFSYDRSDRTVHDEKQWAANAEYANDQQRFLHRYY
jgi:hypothetical protein